MPVDRGDMVGVVVPLHNKGAFIARAIESVLRQTYEHWRLTVVDDGSTDNSSAIVQQFADPRISLLHTPRGGPGAARNAGLRAMSADWVALLDADDEWDTHFLERTARVAAREPDLVAVFAAAAARGAPVEPQTVREGRIDDYFAARLRSRVAITSSSVMLRRAAFMAIGGFREDYAYAEDVEAWFRLVCAGPVYFIPDVLSRIETGDGASITRATASHDKVVGLRHLLESHAVLGAAGRIPAAQAQGCRRFMEHQSGRIAAHLLHAGDPFGAARWLVTRVPLGLHTWRDYLDCLRASLRWRSYGR